MSGLRTGLLFWIFSILAAGFAGHFVFAVNAEDRPFAIAAAVAFVMACVVAAAAFFGGVW